MINRMFLFCCCWLAAAALAGDAPESEVVLTLDSALVQTRHGNYDLRAAEFDREDARGQVMVARAGTLPRIDGRLSGQYRSDPQVPSGHTNQSYGAGVQLRQALYRPAVDAYLAASKAYVGSVDEEVRIVQLAALFTTHRLFYDVLLARENVRVSEEAVELARSHLDDVRKRADRGLARRFEVIRADEELSMEQAQLIASRNALELAGSVLLDHLGLPADRQLRVVGELAFQPQDEPYDRALEEAIASRPELAQLRYRTLMSDEVIRATKAADRPTVDLVADYGDNYPDRLGGQKDEEAWYAGVQVSIPLFTGGETAGKLRQEQARRDQLDVWRDRLLSAVRLEITQARLNLASAAQLVAAREQALKQAAEAVRLAGVGYAEGVNTQLDLLDARVAYTQARRSRAAAVHDHLVAVADLQRATGRLLATPDLSNTKEAQP